MKKVILWLHEVVSGLVVNLLINKDLKKLINSIESKSESLAVNIQDAYALYSAIRKEKPKYILETGSGNSTNYIALAINHNKDEDNNYNCKFVSIEEGEKWFNNTKSLLVENKLDSFVNLLHLPVKESFESGEKVRVFDGVPNYPYEYIHIDGPSTTKECQFTYDCMYYISTQPHIVFDGREFTAYKVNNLLKNGSASYSFKRNLISLNWEIVFS